MAAEYITVVEAAEIRQTSTDVIYRHAVKRRIRSKKKDGRRLILKSDVVNFKKLSGRPRNSKRNGK